MASRSRQSAVSLPAYQRPNHPLTPTALHEIDNLPRTHPTAALEKYIKEASLILAECAGEVNDTLREREERRERVQQSGKTADPRQDAGLEELREKVSTLTGSLDEQVRRLIDTEQHVADIQQTIREGDFARDAPSIVFQQELQARKDDYTALSQMRRYGQHPHYVGFKRTVHDAQHSDEVPLPPPSRWFGESGEPLPGMAGGEEEDSDDDIAIQKETISTKCPLTLCEFKDPITSEKCPHTFEKAAIFEMISSSRVTSTVGTRKGERAVECPVAGCRQTLTKSSLRADPITIRKIRRLQQSRKNEEDDDLDVSFSQNQSSRGRRVILDDDEDDEDEEKGEA
ncbi:hypothetical protein EJ06DRAFT_90350 [Trichodelitschia bisporula]|uniref:SP-RING-type domain-containing protein n=1 Tax=Trichodelitschia bisporula TaxID=703511 RepID=A0A6G1HRW4_9PEZI|nr:hypothetical protein EJ06DRAFT_90350 [Trichodelitschia bisporula]